MECRNKSVLSVAVPWAGLYNARLTEFPGVAPRWLASPSKIASTRFRTASISSCWPPSAHARSRPAPRSPSSATTTRTPSWPCARSPKSRPRCCTTRSRTPRPRSAEIEKRFGKEVARLVDGVTKLTRLELQSDRTKQAENFRKLVLAMSEDIRVLLVKLADRLHNMRTLHFVPSPRSAAPRARRWRSTPARRAHRHGRAQDRARDAVLPRAEPGRLRQTIAARLTFLRGQGGDLSIARSSRIKRVLREAASRCPEVSGREKSPYSIWRKMQRKNVGSSSSPTSWPSASS
jgi:hypothetical protein